MHRTGKPTDKPCPTDGQHLTTTSTTTQTGRIAKDCLCGANPEAMGWPSSGQKHGTRGGLVWRCAAARHGVHTINVWTIKTRKRGQGAPSRRTQMVTAPTNNQQQGPKPTAHTNRIGLRKTKTASGLCGACMCVATTLAGPTVQGPFEGRAGDQDGKAAQARGRGRGEEEGRVRRARPGQKDAPRPAQQAPKQAKIKRNQTSSQARPQQQRTHDNKEPGRGGGGWRRAGG